MVERKSFVFDIETYTNMFALVAREENTKNYLKFVIHESRNDLKDLLLWLDSRPILISFGGVRFDAQVVEHIFRRKITTAEEIYAFAQSCIEADRHQTPYSEWDFTHFHIDLLKLNHYDYGGRTTSLKWLEFTLRKNKIRDLPFEHTEKVSRSNVNKVLTYCRVDVDTTYDFYYKCEAMIARRREHLEKYRQNRVINFSDSTLGSFIMEQRLFEKVDLKKNAVKNGLRRDKIEVKDVILPYIKFENKIFDDILDFYRGLTLHEEDGSIKIKGVIDKKLMFDKCEFSYGYGGLHASTDAGVYQADDFHSVIHVDVKSYYPNLGVSNRFYPEHLTEAFCDVYEEMYQERLKYPKGSLENYEIKIALNAVYGKSNAKHDNFLKDPKYMVSITINGQLLLTMLAERLAQVGSLLIVNTDGIHIKVNRRMESYVTKICKEWEQMTGLNLDYDKYRLLAMSDCNNYIGIYESGKVTRKGSYCIYEDLVGNNGEPHEYHKNPSGAIIPLAISNYFTAGESVCQTINQCNNIHEFAYAVKKQKNFEYWIQIARDNGLIDTTKQYERVFRYFISKKGYNLNKHFNDGRKNNFVAVNKGQLITPLMTIKDENIITDSGKDNYPDLDREYYIFEANKILESLNC